MVEAIPLLQVLQLPQLALRQDHLQEEHHHQRPPELQDLRRQQVLHQELLQVARLVELAEELELRSLSCLFPPCRAADLPREDDEVRRPWALAESRRLPLD